MVPQDGFLHELILAFCGDDCAVLRLVASARAWSERFWIEAHLIRGAYLASCEHQLGRHSESSDEMATYGLAHIGQQSEDGDGIDAHRLIFCDFADSD